MPCLLLDVDGVIVRDKVLFEHMKHNIVRYVSKKLPQCENPAVTNSVLYMGHGHTARGLSKVFGIDASDFNDQVYDKSLMSHLAEVLERDQFKKDAELVHDLTTKGWDITLFSNAPYEWLAPVAIGINDQIKIKCPGPDLTTSYFKPDIEFYRQFDNCKSYYYVDDTSMNLWAARNLPNWRLFHYTEENKNSKFEKVRSIQDLSLKLANLWRSDT